MKITIENLSMVYPNGKTALDQISCTLESPNLIGLLGPNGAGKSTLMKLLTARHLYLRRAEFLSMVNPC